MQKLNVSKILTERQRVILGKLLEIVSVLLMLFAVYYCDHLYPKGGTISWQLNLDLYRLAFLLLIFTIKNGFIKDIAIGLLINHYFDSYYGLTGWTWNDTLTVIYVSLASIVLIIKKIKNDKLRMENIRNIVHTIKRKFTKRSQ